MALAEPAICSGLQSPRSRSSTQVISSEIRLCALRASRRHLSAIRCARSAAYPSPSWLRLSSRLMVLGERLSACAICRCVRTSCFSAELVSLLLSQLPVVPHVYACMGLGSEPPILGVAVIL